MLHTTRGTQVSGTDRAVFVLHRAQTDPQQRPSGYTMTWAVQPTVENAESQDDSNARPDLPSIEHTISPFATGCPANNGTNILNVEDEHTCGQGRFI